MKHATTNRILGTARFDILQVMALTSLLRVATREWSLVGLPTYLLGSDISQYRRPAS